MKMLSYAGDDKRPKPERCCFGVKKHYPYIEFVGANLVFALPLQITGGHHG